jgi:hypothetical protein
VKIRTQETFERAVTIVARMTQVFRLFWVRESGCDAGTALRAGELDEAIRSRVLELASGAGGDGEISLRLPFLDRREWPRRGQILDALPLVRHQRMISCALEPAAAVRDLAATLALTDPAWTNSPGELHLSYFPVWQRVSLALQRSLRSWTAEAWFRDISRYEDRDTAYTMLVYEAARLCYGRPRTEFTYDLRDYPDCRATLVQALKMTGRSLQAVLARTERRLYDAGMPVLARRYSPVWYQDVLVAVRKKPKKFVELLAGESAVINSLIELGTGRSVTSINSFARTANQALRKVYGMDLRELGVRVLEETTRLLEQETPGPIEYVLDRGPFENLDARPSGRPDPGIGRQEDCDHRSPHGSCQVCDP